jgi:7-keto-8-aminopelargonate synthetase-like enzyme
MASAPRITQSPPFESLKADRNRWVPSQFDTPALERTPFVRQYEAFSGVTCQTEGSEAVNFATSDFLGLHSDPRPIAAAAAAMERYGVSALSDRIVSGESLIGQRLLTELARQHDVEAAMCFFSHRAAYAAAMAVLLGKGDIVIHDELVHNSAHVGTALSMASRRSFRHNDLDALEQLLIETAGSYHATLVIVEGHYSMDGDIPDLGRLIELKRKFGFWLMVDEAHGLGCIGATGRGVREVYGIAGTEVDIWMGTLGKALASTGGYIAGSAALIDILKYEAPAAVYSTALPPALAAAAEASLGVMEAEPERVARLQQRGALFLDRARAHGLDVGSSIGSSIIPVMVGSSPLAISASQRLLGMGINVLPIVFPGVPMNQARLRFFLSCLHEEEQIKHAVSCTAQVLEKLKDSSLDDVLKALSAQIPST